MPFDEPTRLLLARVAAAVWILAVSIAFYWENGTYFRQKIGDLLSFAARLAGN
jgi:hypothetical protein